MTRRRSGIHGLGRALLALLLAALPASLCLARPAGSTGPFAELDAIDVAVEIGGPLDVEGSTAPELLVGDLERFNRFETALKRGVGQKLESCGILWDQGAVDEVSILVFGRREGAPPGPAHYVFMVQARVLNTKLARRGAEPERATLRPVIGLADDAGLEEALIDAAVALVGGELRSCGGQGGG